MKEEIMALFQKNAKWAARFEEENPGFFQASAVGQTPKYLWIGCSDSRVPETLITDSEPGEIFTHRNISNQVSLENQSTMEVIDFAINQLKVHHIIICGHYGCGAIQAVKEKKEELSHHSWFRSINETLRKNENKLAEYDPVKAGQKLCELNVIEQVKKLRQTQVVVNAWNQNQNLSIHGWIYQLKTGLLKDLEITISGDIPLNK